VSDAPRKPGENRQRRHMIGVRVTEEEFAALTAAAGTLHTSVPDMLRALGLAKAGVEYTYHPYADRGFPPGSRLAFAATNTGRSRAAAQRDVAVARRALESAPHPDWPLWWGAVAKARVDLPGATLAEVGARIGVSKHSAAAAMRRLRAAMASAGDGEPR